MKKNIRTKFKVRAIVTSALVLVSAFCVASMGNKSAWSQEVSEPGMGMPDDQAARVQELIDSGMSFSEAYAIMLGEYNVPVEYDTPSANTNANTQTETKPAPSTEAAPSTSNTEKSESKTAPKTETKPTKVYSHDFDAITDEAKDNFIHFSEDGTPDSMYLNIRAESAMNTITGRELNATTSGNEVGTINYVDAEGNVRHSWIFENWKSDDDFYLDLSAYLKTYASEELVAAYEVSLQDATLPKGNTVKLKVQSPYADGTVVYIFAEEAGELKETGMTLTVTEGYITFEFTDAIVSPVLSPEALVVKATENTDEATIENSAEETDAATEDVSETVEPAHLQEVTTESGNHTVLIIICLLAIVAIVGFVLAIKRK